MRNKTIALLVLACIVVLVIAGCGGVTTTATPAPAAPAGAQSSVPAVLTVVGAVEKSMSWSLDGLKGLGTVKLDLNHPKKGQVTYEGVRLSVLLGAAKPNAAAKMLTLSARDGYSVDVKLADLAKCADCLLTIDSVGSLSTAMPDLESGTWVRDLLKIEVK